MVLSLSQKIILLSAIFIAPLWSQNDQSNELLKQAENLLNTRDFAKAKLTIKLYQKYVENDLTKWLNAQNMLIQAEVELNNFNEAEKLINNSNSQVKNLVNENFELIKELRFTEAYLLEVKNRFQEAEKIYRQLLSKYKSPDIMVRLANNLIDRVLAGYTNSSQKDYEELRSIISTYEKNSDRNPLELIRIKQKINSYQMVNNKTLADLEKLDSFWIQKDEFTLFRIYLNNVMRRYDTAYELWNQNKKLINLKTHPLTVPTLVNLSRHYLKIDIKRSIEINKVLPVLVRDQKEKNLIDLITIEQLIHEKKPGEAMALYETSIKSNPQNNLRLEMEISLAEAFLELKDFKVSESLLKHSAKKTITDAELKSRKVYVEASLLQAAGNDKEAAVLFLRVGQTATNAETALRSLFKAGKSFYNANQCNRAVIAFKMLLEKPRNKYSDESLYYLSLSHAQCKDYKDALNSIDQLILTGKNPDLKKKALFEKGDYWLKAGDPDKAIEAYNDYTVVYTKDSRNAAIWYKIYKIHIGQKDIAKSETILNKIIDKSSQSSPEVYSDSLHQKALIHQLRAENRDSIGLWLRYLEFNQQAPTKLDDEVKLMLAAAYQNSDTLNLSAASSIFVDIVESSKDNKAREIALLNLLKLTQDKPSEYKEALNKVLRSKHTFSRQVYDLLLSQSLSIKELHESAESFINSLKDIQNKSYWKAKLNFAAKDTKLYPEALAHLDLINKDDLLLKKRSLQRDIFLALGKKVEALNACLEIIYSVSAKISKDQYSDWLEIDKSVLTSIQILNESGRHEQALKIRDRILLAKLPVSPKTKQTIDEILKEKK